MRRRQSTLLRVTVVLLSLLGIIGLCVHYAATYDDRWPYPTAEQLDANYDAHLGDTVLVFGQVIDVQSTYLVIDVDGVENLVLKVDHTPDAIEPGGVVQVYGTVEPEYHVAGADVTVVDRNPSGFLYKLAMSVLGVTLAVGYFCYHWRLTLRPVGWEVRRG